MRNLRAIYGWAASVVWGFAAWLCLHGEAFAQVTPKEEKSSNAYVFSYFLVLLGIAAGMALVCRSSNRRDRARPEQYAKGAPGEKKK